jgi:hypothetical protein
MTTQPRHDDARPTLPEVVAVGHWVQRFFPHAYEAAMRRLNDRLSAVAERARSG